MNQKLLLFDIDNTLTRSSAAHRAALHFALQSVYGIAANIDVIKFHGMTDQQIIIEVMKKYGLGETAVRANLEACMKLMVTRFLEINDDFELVTLDGVGELLKERARAGHLMGLVTGNLEGIAWAKLAKVGLDTFFRCGGFGSDHIDRAELVRIALKRAREKIGFEHNGNAFLFGDTPLDIRAGKEAGVITVGVATGHYSVSELQSCTPDFVVENLRDIGHITRIISGANLPGSLQRHSP
jgi:phosphoglycolate phosphatase-like HAD superfamily hydrolase